MGDKPWITPTIPASKDTGRDYDAVSRMLIEYLTPCFGYMASRLRNSTPPGDRSTMVAQDTHPSTTRPHITPPRGPYHD